MNYLARLPVEILKIDRSFVNDLVPDDAPGRSVIEAITSLGHSLQLVVLVEGIETEIEWDAAVRIEVDYVQGFFTGHPMPADEFSAALRAA